MDKIRIACKSAASIDIDQLTEFQGELKTLTEEDFQKLRKQILELGFSASVHIWQNKGKNYILDGHQRVRTLNRMAEEGFGIPALPVTLVEADSYKQAKRKLLGMTSQYGQMQEKGLYDFMTDSDIGIQELLADTKLPDVDMGKFEDTYFTKPSDKDPDDAPGPPANPISKRGDLWVLGGHRLLCGDCTSSEDVGKLMGEEKATLMATDPPYNIQTLGGFGSQGNRSYAGLTRPPSYQSWMSVSLNHLSEKASVFVWEDWRNVVPLWNALESNIGKVRDFVVWHVTNRRARQFRKGFYPEFDMCLFAARSKEFLWHFPDTGSRANVYTSGAVQDHSGVYGKKPVDLLKRFIEITMDPGGVCYEPFSGSGSQIIAAENLGRRCFAVEIEPAYVDVAVKRWEDFTGRKAKLINAS